jgi:hypothetical protein
MHYFNAVTNSVKEVLKELNIDFYINLHIEGDAEGFEHEHIKAGEKNPIASFCDFLDADLVISSKSSHSTVPVILSGKLMIYPDDSWFAPLPSWVSANKEGAFDRSKFINVIKNYYYKML